MGKKRWFIIGFNALALALIDQFTKWLATNYLPTPLQVAPQISLRYAENTGIAWSIPLPEPIILPLSVVLFVVIIYSVAQNVDLRYKESKIILTLLLGGALGNLIDRFAKGYVVDFISIGGWPIFNLADAFLTIGVFLMVLFYVKIRRA